jgi:hypothetical protein
MVPTRTQTLTDPGFDHLERHLLRLGTRENDQENK